MKDELFGNLQWTHNDLWAVPVEVDYFHGFGERVFASAEHPDPPPLAPATKSKRATKAQREARRDLQAFAQTASAKEQDLLKRMMGVLSRPTGGVDDRPHSGPGNGMVRNAEPSYEERLFRQGKFLLTIDTKHRRTRPTLAQSRAWRAVLDAGDSLWDSVVRRVLAQYRAERPVRAHWWRTIFGKHGLARALPAVKDRRGLRPLVWPFGARIGHARGDEEPPDVGVHFVCTWANDGFGVRLRRGRVVEVGMAAVAFPAEDRGTVTLANPVFGTLRRVPGDTRDVFGPAEADELGTSAESLPLPDIVEGGPAPWEGTTRCEPFRVFANVAAERASFRDDPAKFGPPRLELDWDFVRGNFGLRVHIPEEGRRPTKGQTAALAAFRRDEARHASTIVNAIFEHYRKNIARHRRAWKYAHVDEVIPRLKTAEGLHDRMQLRNIHVHPEDTRGRVALGLQFSCSWSYDGLGVLWQNGQVTAVGQWDDAEPR